MLTSSSAESKHRHLTKKKAESDGRGKRPAWLRIESSMDSIWVILEPLNAIVWHRRAQLVANDLSCRPFLRNEQRPIKFLRYSGDAVRALISSEGCPAGLAGLWAVCRPRRATRLGNVGSFAPCARSGSLKRSAQAFENVHKHAAAPRQRRGVHGPCQDVLW
jgi:hypothetical protein